MADAGWVIRFYDLSKDVRKIESTKIIVTNLHGHGREKDNVRVFRGMYGLDNYLIWEVQRDLPQYDFKTVGIEFKLLLHRNPKLVYFKDYYRVMDVRYDPNKSKFIVFCLSEDSLLLKTRLIDTKITPPVYNETRTGIQLLKEMLEKVVDVVEHRDYENTKDLIHFSYRYLNYDPLWTLYELIDYIASENQYEWYLENKTLHIGHALHAQDDRNCTKTIDKFHDHLSYSHFYFKININSAPINVLGHFNKAYRCVWVKHWAGATGGITKGAFIPIGWGHLTKQLYINCLESDLERNQAYSLLVKTAKYPGVTIGNILEDLGGNTIKSISVQKNPNTYVMKTPNDIIIDRVGEHEVVLQKHELCRTTPYLDHNAGMLFPSPSIANEPPPNSILFNINNRGEASVVGPYVYGSGRDGLVIPTKGKADFRLQFPNGWCLYVKENGYTILKPSNTDPSTVPTLGFGEMGMIFDPENEKIDLQTSPAHGIYFTGGRPLGDITIQFGTSKIVINKDGNINILSNQIVNVGEFATNVNLAGGAKALAHAFHIHTTGNMGIPIDPCKDNTIKTKAD